MILVDTSVLIDYQRTRDPKLKQLFASLPVAICGATRAEILHGARDLADRQQLLTLLNSFSSTQFRTPFGTHSAIISPRFGPLA